MNWKHLLWIVPLALIIGLAFGFASSVYIVVPEKVTIEMGYEPETIEFMKQAIKCQNGSLGDLPEPVVMNVTWREVKNIPQFYGAE